MNTKKGSKQGIGNTLKFNMREYPKKIGRKLKSKLKNEGNINKIQKRSFTDFSGFLANSIVSPYIYAPFSEPDKRCFATMENITRYLTSLSNDVSNSPLVSVIMPVHNRIDSVEDAIKSVLEQSYTNIELIVVDDGSEDGSKELLENINNKKIVLLHNDKCKGVSNARNMGLSVAKGKYIAYLDSDNLWDSRYLAAMVGAFLELPDADALYCGQLLFKDKDKHPSAVRFGSFNRSLLKNRNYIDINAFCHTYEIYKRIGGFDENLKRLVDYDLIMRISETAQIYSVPVLLSHYYYDKANNTITKTPGYTEHLENVREIRRKRMKFRRSESSGENINSNEHPSHKVSVIIPSYEALEDIKECIESILKSYGSEKLEIIVIDNFSSNSVLEYLDQLKANGLIKLIKNDINYGFTQAVNQGIGIAGKGNDIVIMNNDAILTPDAIVNLEKAAYELSECGIVVPQQVLPGGTKTINMHVPFAYPQYDCDVNLSAHHENIINVPVFHAGRVVEISFAPFFCVYIKRQVLDNSMGLDAEYGRHYRSDRIFCNYIRHMMNLKIYHVEKAVVYHKLQKATDDLRRNPDKGDSFDVMFYKNQWDDELASQLGYKKPIWDY